MRDVTSEELQRIGTRDGDVWTIGNQKYLENVLARYEDGSPRRTILTMIDDPVEGDDAP
jgi:hypothetical protein